MIVNMVGLKGNFLPNMQHSLCGIVLCSGWVSAQYIQAIALNAAVLGSIPSLQRSLFSPANFLFSNCQQRPKMKLSG